MTDATGSSAVLLVEQHPGFWFARLNRPDKRNALSDELVAALNGLLDRVAADLDARALVLSGAGGHFCAGADFGRFLELMQTTPGHAERHLGHGKRRVLRGDDAIAGRGEAAAATHGAAADHGDGGDR